MPEASPRQSLSALFAHGLLLGGAGAAIFLAGNAPQGNLGVFLLCAGLALVVCPPRVRVGWPLWAAAAGLVICGGLAFLPARWMPQPLWRRAIAAAPAVTLPSTITAAPAETAFWLALLAVTMVIGLFALAQPVRARGMIALVLAAVLGCAVYAGLAMYAKVSGWHYPFSGKATFGFLPNRNHSATFLITGSVLAAGLMSVAFRDRRWAVADAAVAGGLVCLAALFFFSESRAGVLILLAGGGLWLAGLSGRHRPTRLLVVVAVVGAVAGGMFLVFPSPARDRLLETVGIRAAGGRRATSAPKPIARVQTDRAAGGRAVEPPSEFRTAIYRDTLDMIRDQPWTGTGLGTFAGVFPQYRRASLVEFNALHPESDWLMLMAEAGLPACLCAAGLVVLAARRLAGLGHHPYWPLRWACAAAVAAALLHGAVDVPTHRAALGWWVLALGGLALQRQSQKEEGAGDFNAKTRRTGRLAKGETQAGSGWHGKVQHTVFILVGIGALALGGMLVRAEWFHGPALPPFAAEQAPRQLFDAYQQKRYVAGIALAQRTLRDAPLTAAAYYYLGTLLAVSDEEGVDAQVDDLFQAERVLDPVMPNVARRQGLAWAGYDPVRQTAADMDELGRMGRINRALARSGQEDVPYYGSLVSQATAQPDVQRYLLAVARPDPRFEEMWKRAANPALVQTRVDRLAEDAAWAGRQAQGGDGSRRPDWYLEDEIAGPARPAAPAHAGEPPGKWEGSGWPVRLRQFVEAGRYEQAVGMLSARYRIALALPDAATPGEAAETGAAAAFTTAWRAGDQAAARRGLAETSVDEGDPAALEAWRWRAALAAHDGKWRESFLALERYVRHTRQMEWP